MVLNQFGSIPHDLAMDNIKLMGEKVLPKLRPHLGRPVGGPLVAQAAGAQRQAPAAPSRCWRGARSRERALVERAAGRRSAAAPFETEVWEAGERRPAALPARRGRSAWDALPATPWPSSTAWSRRSTPASAARPAPSTCSRPADLIYYYLDLLDRLGAARPAAGRARARRHDRRRAGGRPAGSLHRAGADRADGPLATRTIRSRTSSPCRRSSWRRALPRPDSPAARAAAEAPTEGDAMIEYHLERAKSMATAAKYLWPIPNRGLAKRAAPRLGADADRLGRQRRIASPRYAEAFREQIKGSPVEIVEEAGRPAARRAASPPCRLSSSFLAGVRRLVEFALRDPRRPSGARGAVVAGSGEFRPPMVQVDRELLRHTPGRPPKVAILPTAAGQEVTVASWIRDGIAHFTRLGCEAYGVRAIDRAGCRGPGVCRR